MIRRNFRRSFTLVELLAVIMVFSILLSIVLAGVASAQRFAKEAHTKDLIARLNTVIMAKWNSYLTRRVPVDLTKTTDRASAAELRLDALHELMRMEMPERFTDITSDRTSKLTYDPFLRGVYKAQYDTANAKSPSTMTLNQPAKCLFMIVTAGTDDSDDRDFFSESDIVDIDGDGLRVFVDAWGKPIQFLRWAPAFESELQPKPPVAAYQFDPLGVLAKRRNTASFALYPLIYSGGPDETLDLNSGSITYSTIKNDPFDDKVRTVVGEVGITTKGEDHYSDNIHSHFIVID